MRPPAQTEKTAVEPVHVLGGRDHSLTPQPLPVLPHASASKVEAFSSFVISFISLLIVFDDWSAPRKDLPSAAGPGGR